MSLGVVDLFSGVFWLAVVLAVALVAPLTQPSARKIAFGAVNGVFLYLLLAERVLAVLAGVLVLFAVLKWIREGTRASFVFAVTLLVSLCVLVIHKLPGPAPRALEGFDRVLVSVGYSYVFLRVVDVLRSMKEGRHSVPDPIALFNYVLPFHMLAAGPIQSFDAFMAQPAVPVPLGFAGALGAVERIAWGMFKKFVVAFVIERAFLTRFTMGGYYRLVEIQLYALWFYLDFSAYSDVAVGIGRLLGVATPENFDRPYLARNMIAFWDRWHITLSEWIRRNLFIPLQLSLVRRSGGKYELFIASLSILGAFVLCGLWHGATLPFFLWGTMHGLGVMVTNVYRHVLTKRLGRAGVKAYLSRPGIRILATLMTVEYVGISLMIVGWHWGA